jgi:hypothetical protein
VHFELLQLQTSSPVMQVPTGFTVLGVHGADDRALVVQQLRSLLRGDPSPFRAQVNISGESFECDPQVSRLIASALGQLDPVLEAVDVLGESIHAAGAPPISPLTVMIAFECQRGLTRVALRQLQADSRAVTRLAEIRAARARIATSVESSGKWALTFLDLEQEILDLNLDLAGRIRNAHPDETHARNILRRELRDRLARIADLLSLDRREQTLEASLRSWVEVQIHPKRPEPSVALAKLRIQAACQHHRLVANVGGSPLIADDPIVGVSNELQQALIGTLADEAEHGVQVLYVTDRPQEIEAFVTAHRAVLR